MTDTKIIWEALISQAREEFNEAVLDEDEMTVEDFMKQSDGLFNRHDTTYKYLTRLVANGQLTKRVVLINGRKTSVFKLVKKSS